ncbi:MAG: hypothetical protein IPP94_18710 [Ignavibacteria bacterium]|nr:hypothetical protein [Ignavibacteria bacterium]
MRTVFAILLFFVLVAALPPVARAQRELLPATDPVYEFLFRQELKGNIGGYHHGMLPLSRADVAGFLDSLEGAPLSGTDRGLLRDFRVRLSYDRTSTLASSSSFLPDFGFAGMFDDARQKYLYASADSATAIFLDAFAWLSYRAGRGDSTGAADALLGEAGLRLRGTLMKRLGLFIQVSNGMLLGGSHDFALLDPRLRASKKFISDEKKFFDITTGYLRYDADWLAVTAGREQLLWGMGYSDRMVFSNNTNPFDYFRIDLRSGGVRYTFLHGSLVSLDTNGRTASSKYIASHRVEFDAGKAARIGISEAVIYSNKPPLFALMNPMIFLTSAELSSEAVGENGTIDNAHNSIIWVDAEFRPLRNLRVTGTWLIDDFSWSAIGKTSIAANTNKFGVQAGAQWNDALLLDGLLLSLEYTRIGPFVQSHWTQVNSFTHSEQPLGHALHPNSDEWALAAGFDITPRLRLGAKAQFQRSGVNITDADGRVIFDAGSDILRGSGALQHPNRFLDGRRINRIFGTLSVTWQPVRQYFIDLALFTRTFSYVDEGRSLNDTMLWTTFRIEY